jgi:hypothetical protein
MEARDLIGWIQASKEAVSLIKNAYELLPKGSKRDEIENKVKLASQILERGDAKLAKELGFVLCKCTFPPQIMLWNEQEKADICPRVVCGHMRSKHSSNIVNFSTTGTL